MEGICNDLLDIDIPKFYKSNARFAFIQWNLSVLRLKVNMQNNREKLSCLLFFFSVHLSLFFLLFV